MSLKNFSFNLSTTSRFTGAKSDSIQNWTKGRKIVGTHKIEGGGSQGKHRRYSFLNVMEIAIANELFNLGIKSVDQAFKAAHVFSHSDEGSPVGKRQIGRPYHHNLGDTFLYVSGDRTSVLVDRDGRITQSEILNSLNSREKPKGCTSLNVTEVFRDVVQRMDLNFEAHKLLDEAYPEDAS